jgi:hypothetical protein
MVFPFKRHRPVRAPLLDFLPGIKVRVYVRHDEPQRLENREHQRGYLSAYHMNINKSS